ncbi:MAG: hypothetical protein C5B50_05190 [Verrucomicrobia bacterium]|nr:MAG: hypothetical protein C5B50_05190 [Verrucomicrobiota bacterium]
MAGLFSAGAFFSALWLVPPHWYRTAGVLDLVIVLDNSTSYAKALPVAVKEATPIIASLLPGDRLATFVVGPEVLQLFNGAVLSASAASSVGQQVRALQVNTNGGTELGTVFNQVRKAFDDFAVAPSAHFRRERLLVIFSDCLGESGSQPIAGSAAMVPGRTTVLVVGWQGSDKDPVARVLLGPDGKNILQAVPTEAAPEARRVALEDIEAAHPLKVVVVVAASLICLLCGASAAGAVEAFVGARSRPLHVRLSQRGEADTTQDFPLAMGETLVVGGGDGNVDYHVPGAAHCLLTRNRRDLIVVPGSAPLLIRRRGVDLPVSEAQMLRDKDALLLQGREIEVSLS